MAQVARLGAQLLLQAALEAEVGEFRGRERYARQAGNNEARKGMRNGYSPTTIKTTAGPVTLQRPKLRGTTERFASQLFGTGVLRANALEALVIASFVRGLSVRDAEATLVEALGEDATVSKSAVSRICGQLKEQSETWSRRRLDDVTLDYLFLEVKADFWAIFEVPDTVEPGLDAVALVQKRIDQVTLRWRDSCPSCGDRLAGF